MDSKHDQLIFRQPNAESPFELARWLFLRGLALIYFVAFASLSTQIDGLIGSQGILPLQQALQALTGEVGDKKYWLFPTLFWFDDSDRTLTAACYLGMAGAVLLLFNRFERTALALCYALYLSLTVAGRDFTAFQWDALLLESGFLALFLTWGSPVVFFLYRFLIARFMFMGGVVKLASGDPVWSDLTALDYHYLTQPLPTPLAYYAYHLPHWFNHLCVAGVLVIELILPFFVFLPRRFRHIAGWSFIALQSGILLTGNYNFFNLLTLLLCLFLFDDRALEPLLPASLSAAIRRQSRTPGPVANTLAILWLLLVMLTCAGRIWLYHSRPSAPAVIKSLLQPIAAFSVVNNYGPFAVMTTQRPEIIVQGSADGEHWQTYRFKYKPVALDQRLSWNIPFQPRLDWQMWFAALSTQHPPAWFSGFVAALLKGSPPVLSLLAGNPFPTKPPIFVRALLYRYSFTTPEQRAASGDTWKREYLGVYWPASRLKGSAPTL